MALRIGLITTINTNIGDDFIREGICLVLREVFKGNDIEFVLVNKHQPLMVYPGWHPVHLTSMTRYLPKGRSRARRLIERFAPKLRLSYFDQCNIIVQCGAPVFWRGCHRCEWAEPLWHSVVGRLSQRVPVLNLAAGSCYPWERQPTGVDDPDDAQYLRAILGYCRITTVRDTLGQRLCASLGTHTPLISCSAFLAARNYIGTGNDEEIVLINYMSGGGHYDWDQGIDASLWLETVKALIGRLQERHKLAFLCHNETEYRLAQDLNTTLPCLWPKTPREYFTLVSKAKVALCNRMHASLGLAGLGIPSIAVCTDTRLLMVDTIDLPCLYVKEATVEKIEDGLENLLANRERERERLLMLCDQTWNQYVKVVEENLCS